MVSLAALVVAAAAAASAASAPAPARPSGEPRVERRIAEDDNVRIEEVRVRGESRRIVVKPKAASAPEYEIEPASGARDPSQRNRRAAGERTWRLLSF